MNHMIDVCEYCDTFQRVTVEDVEDNGDAHLICSTCLAMRWGEEIEPTKEVNLKKYKWKEVSSV